MQLTMHSSHTIVIMSYLLLCREIVIYHYLLVHINQGLYDITYIVYLYPYVIYNNILFILCFQIKCVDTFLCINLYKYIVLYTLY